MQVDEEFQPLVAEPGHHAPGTRRRRRALVVAGVLVVAGAAGVVVLTGSDGAAPVAAPTVAPSGCGSSPLPLPPGADGLGVHGVDPTGRHLVAVPNHDGKWMAAMLWTDGGQPQPLPVGQEFTPAGVNASGLIVGTRYVQQRYEVVLIRDGQVVPLPSPRGSQNTTAAGINTRGDVVGSAILADAGERAVLWRAGAAEPTLLTDGTRQTRAIGVNDDGVVLGTSGRIRHAVQWAPDGTATALPLPDGYSAADASAISGDWAAGWVSGEIVVQDDESIEDPARPGGAVRWNLRTGAVDWLPRSVGVLAVGPSGVVAGPLSGSGSPAIWRDGAIFPLPLPMPDPAPSTVVWIGPDGHTMIGTVRHDEYGAALVVWRGC